MEQPDVEKSCPSSEDGGLTRNRSFKSKQLVRSQAIRESTSPPRTVSPYVKDQDSNTEDNIGASERDNSDTSSHSDRCTVISNDRLCDKKQPVEIQITSGSWESEAPSEQRLRTRRWLGHRPHSDSSRDLLSYGPRLTCVCGSCACPYCRGKRRKNVCPTKQDSGIVCSDDCPDCTDSENGPNGSGSKKSGSFDADDQTFYCRCPERREKPKSYSVSGTDFETEPSVPELVGFIKETLNKNPRDRITMLKIEKELHALVSDSGRCVVRFPVMTSYGRMLVHRCAALFHLAHRLDHHDHDDHHHPHHSDHHRSPRVLVSKSGTSGGRIPCTSFREWCTTVFPQSPPRERHDRVDSNEENVLAKSILKRSAAGRAPPAAAAGRSKSLEQRERDYERVRRRIFSTDNCTQDESQWPWLSGPVKLLTPETGRNKLLKVQSLESRNVTGASPSARGPVSKSHSFGGYSGEPPPQRLLSRQGDLASSSWRLSRLSPSSSGYKTLSLRSTDSVTPSPTGGASPEPVGAGSVPGAEGATFLWAVTDMSAVPAGALVIHPQTGRPLTNPDGSVYHFDRNNPPVLYDAAGYVHRVGGVGGVGGAAGVDEEKVDLNNEKRRGKLEKQHSFIDNDCECQPSEECRTKCCCDCGRHDGGEKVTSAKNSPQKTKPSSIPSSPMKKNYETKTITPEPKQEPETVYESQTETYEPQKPDVETPKEVKYEANVNNNIVKRFESPPQRPSDQHQHVNQNQRLETQKQYEPNQRPLESNKRSFENQNSFEASQRSFENTNSFETNQRSVEVNQRSFEANQRSFDRYEKPFEQRVVKEEVYQQNYVQTYRNEEIISPQNMVTYHQPEMPEQQVIVQAKVTPVQLPDPNIRPMSLTNVMYPAMPHNAYPYVNTCRIEQVPAQMYQQLVQTEEHKQMTSSPHTDTTFRIDPSYPYAADFNAACGACDPAVATANAAATNMHATRGYNMTYNQVEVPPGLVPPYAPNVLIQPPAQLPAPLPAHGYPYQDQIPLQWQNVQQPLPITQNKLLVQELYPLVYPAVCPNVCPTVCPTVGPPYNLVYPHLGGQVVPQPYPIVQPIYPMLDKQMDRRNLPRPKRTPSRQYGDDTKAHDDSDLQLRIQQIKEQISRRNSGTGLLGSYPATYNGNIVGTATDDTQLSSAARAIVNSIRNLQVKNNYQARAPAPREPLHAHAHAHARRRDDERRPRPLCRPPCLIRQMSPGTWCRRSPGPLPTANDAMNPGFNQPRRPHPDARNGRR